MLEITRFHIPTGYVFGTVGPFRFVAQVENDRSPENVNGGRVAQLGIIDAERGKHVARYGCAIADDIEPTTDEARQAVALVLETCDAAPIVDRERV